MIPCREFYVYTHARPDGQVFYVGKGSERRAWDFSPTRRTRHHINIVRKHGAKNIIVEIIPQPDEASAFAHEIALIATYRALSVKLLNLTDGGEGSAGRPLTAAQQAYFALGRRSWSERNLSLEAMSSIRSALKKGRANASAWRRSVMGQAHARSLYLASGAELEARTPHGVVCASCKSAFMAKHARAKYCSKACGLRAMRQRRKEPSWEDRELVAYSNSTTGVRGVYLNKNGTWKAMIGRDGKLIYLGTFETKEGASVARLEAEKQYGKPRETGRPRTHGLL